MVGIYMSIWNNYVRFSTDDDSQGGSLLASYFKQLWNIIVKQPKATYKNYHTRSPFHDLKILFKD